MFRMPLTVVLLAGLIRTVRAANVVHAGPNSARLQRTAEHVFQFVDSDKSGTLSPAEQARGEWRAEKALQQLVHDNVIGGQIPLPCVAEPQVADPAAMTRPEFTQPFRVLAAKKDASLRASRVARHRAPASQPVNLPAPVVVTIRGREGDKYDDDRLRDERIARDWRYRQDIRYFTPPQGYFQPNQFQSAPPTVVGAPAHSGKPDGARPSSSDYGSGSSHESGSMHEPVTKHEPAHNHQPPPRYELQHNHCGHRGK